MSWKRAARLSEQLKREISEVLRREVKDPRLGVTPTVTDVEVSNDLWSARVYVRIAGDDEVRTQALEGLQSASPFIRRELGKVLRVRRIPELQFRLDRSMEHARRIEEILSDLERGHASDDAGDSDLP
ncbi:MAG: 30S ribosome-binding factor RbfA [Gemmatimonadetes bacterium]|nr:30S ribosome-binding factor RbfA [Gemmatimonadota bacterium]